jgi:hypothetical protein
MKKAIKNLYIRKLQSTYDFYQEGSRPLELANLAAERALAGDLKLEGDSWNAAVTEITGWSRWTMRDLKNLPD